MDILKLERPTPAHKERALAYRQEHRAAGELWLHGGALLGEKEYEGWLLLLEQNSHPETVPEDWVVSSTFFAVREGDGEIVGMVDIRHSLNDFLAAFGGHIGFGVRPSLRGRGYATQILKLAVEYASTLGLPRVMVACHEENAASRQTILRCGGGLEREFLDDEGKGGQVFWIDCPPPPPAQ